MYLRKAVCGLLAVVLCLTVMTVTAFAQESENSNANSTSTASSNELSIQDARASYALIYPQGTSFTLGHSVSKVEYKGTYGLLGKSGVVILRFTNVNTGDSRSNTFICDGSTHVESLPYTLPAGSYRVTCEVNSVKSLKQLAISFMS